MGGATIVLLIAFVLLVNLYAASSSRPNRASLAFSDFIADVERGQVGDVVLAGSNITGHFSDGRFFSTYSPEMPELVGRLAAKGVRITAMPEVPSGFSILVSWIPMFLLLLGLWYFIGRPLRAAIALLREIHGTLDRSAGPPASAGSATPNDR